VAPVGAHLERGKKKRGEERRVGRGRRTLEGRCKSGTISCSLKHGGGEVRMAEGKRELLAIAPLGS